MKKLFGIVALLIAISLPALAQGQQRRLSADDQRRFDSYYSRWLDYKRTNNQGEVVSMEKRMQDIYAHYGIPSNVPYSRIASNGQVVATSQRYFSKWNAKRAAKRLANGNGYRLRVDGREVQA